MAHLALYRKYRPNGFEHLLGQDHIKKTLLNAINQDSISHAYLFSGPRGTGKTSSAKLFAKAINCNEAVNGEPCGKCDNCSESNPDIIEIDAASNNGVDEIREIRDKIGYTPVYGKFKVYIIDEVHMLTIGAFNALLKTLEEPPKHAIFILATTEPHKIPLTILSRLQRFDFKRITDSAIVERMNYILKQENADVEPTALEVIARVAQGGMRDALSLLDQALAHSDGKVTMSDVVELTGTVDLTKIGDVIAAIDKKDTSLVLDLLDQIIDSGKEPRFFLDDLLAYYRDILVFRRVGDKANLTKAITDGSFKSIATNVNVDRIYSIIDILSKCQNQIKYSGQDKVILEVALIKATADNEQDEIALLKNEIAKLKRMMASGQIPIVEQSEVAITKEQAPPNTTEEAAIPKNVDETSLPEVNVDISDLSSMLRENPNIDDNKEEEPVVVDNDLDAFCHEMNGEKVIHANDVKESAPVQEEESKNEVVDEEKVNDQPKTEDLVSEESGGLFDLLSAFENELKSGASEESSKDSPKEEKPVVETNNDNNESFTFLDQVQKDMEVGADYINVVDENIPASDGLVPPPLEGEEDNIPPVSDNPENQEQKEITLSDKGNRVLEILAVAKKDYRKEYYDKQQLVHDTIKQERMSVLALYREGQVLAVSDSHIVVVMGAKPQVKLLEKVSNRSIVQGVLEEIFGRSLELAVIDTKEWEQVREVFVALNK